MPKTKEEILADIAKAVEGQGNQGATAIAPILKDIVELAAQGGGGGSTPNVIQVSSSDGVNWTIDSPDDLEGIAAKAEQGELVMIKALQELGGQTVSTVAAAKYISMSGQIILGNDTVTVGEEGVSSMSIAIDVVQKTVTAQTNSYPS